MSRCGCSSSVCTCFVTGSGNASVTGTGSETNPYVVDVDPAAIQAGTNVTVTGSGTPENPYIINSSGSGGGGLDSEAMMDYLGGVTTPAQGLKGSGLITLTYNDSAGTLTVATTATANSTDAFLRSRANHTGSAPVWRTSYDDVSDTAPTEGQSYRSVSGVLTPYTPSDSTLKADKSGSVRQFADVSDLPFTDEDVPMFNVGTGALEPTDLSTRFAAADPTTSDILYTALAPFMGLMFIKNEGDPDPTGLPFGLGIPIVGFRRQSAASIIPVFNGSQTGTAVDHLDITSSQAFVAGDDLLLVAGASGEVGTGGFPAEMALTYASPGVGPVTMRVRGAQSTTAQCAIYQGKVTTGFPAGTVLTVTARNTTNTANQQRAHFLAVTAKLPNLSATPFDQSIGVNAGGSGVLDLSLGPTGATALSNEIAIMGIVMSGGANPAIRSIAGTNGWNLMSGLETDSGTSSRLLSVFYKLLTVTGPVTGTVHVTSSDGQTGGWGGAVATFKGA